MTPLLTYQPLIISWTGTEIEMSKRQFVTSKRSTFEMSSGVVALMAWPPQSSLTLLVLEMTRHPVVALRSVLNR